MRRQPDAARVRIMLVCRTTEHSRTDSKASVTIRVAVLTRLASNGGIPKTRTSAS